MRGRGSAWLLCAAMAGLLACASEPRDADPPGSDESPKVAAASNETKVAYADPATRFRFDVPSHTVEVSHRHFDPRTPTRKVKNRFELRMGGELLVRIDTWTNPEKLVPQTWIDRYADYLNLGGTRFEERKVGRRRIPAVIADTPASCHATNVVTAVFAIDEHMVAVTCRDGQDPTGRRAFETVLDSFATEGAQ